MRKKVLAIILFSLGLTSGRAQNRWVDSVLNTLDREARIGQLLMVPISSAGTEENVSNWIEEIKESSPGSIFITGGGPVSHANLLNQLQKISPVPLLAAIQAEWGVGQTLDSVLALPKPMVTSSWTRDSLVTLWSHQISLQLKRLGLHLNFAPNADNASFGGDYLRYFSNNEDKVLTGTLQFMKAHQANGILTVARHPARNLPSVTSAGDSTLFINGQLPEGKGITSFRKLVENGVDGIYTHHIHFSIKTETGIMPAASSTLFASGILRKKMNFRGLIIANDNDFRKSKKKLKTGDAALNAFENGNDIVVIHDAPSAVIKKIAKRIKKDKLLQQQLDASVRRVLEAKFKAGLNRYLPVSTDNLVRNLNSPEQRLLVHRFAEESVTVLKNENNILPVVMLENKSFVCLSIGKTSENEFAHYLRKYAPFECLSIMNPGDTAGLKLKGKVIVTGVFQDVSNEITAWLKKLAESEQVIVVHFNNPASIPEYPHSIALLAAYTSDEETCHVVPQIIFGAIHAKGIFPVETPGFSPGSGLSTGVTDRLSYSLPEAEGLDSRILEKIETIMQEAVSSGATPGCHVLIARRGKVVYERSAGYLTYEKKHRVTDETIYDLASVTKISATLQTTMFLYERRIVDLNKKASLYLPELRGSNKKDLILKDILAHQAGLWPTIFFWTQTIKDSKQLPEYYSQDESPDYPFPVSGNIFAVKSMKDSLWKWTIDSKMREKPLRTPYDFRYSDVGSYILHHLAEKMLNQPMEDFLDQNLYEPLGAYTLGYLPLTRFPVNRIAPTENDTLFRKTLLVGYVHDQGAAMHGGIAGHAGLFGNANDLAKLGQLWLQKGHYGGLQYFKPSTVELFTSRQYEDSRRALGWDRPPLGEWVSPTSQFASQKTYGHTGFTGTCIWVDPEFDLVYVFLSNRVNPDMNNNKLLNQNIRSRIHDVIYQSIFNYCSH